jgi:cell division septation protein DedD
LVKIYNRCTLRFGPDQGSLWGSVMVKKDAKSGKEGSAYSDSAEIFENIFKEATQSTEEPKQAARTSTDKKGAAPQKRTPQVERKPTGPVQTPSRPGGRARGGPTQTKIKSESERKPRKPTSILKIVILFVLFLILGGALLNYFGMVDVSVVIDLFGLGKKEVVQVPPQKRAPGKTPGKAGRASANKRGGEKVAAAPKKAEPAAPVEAEQQPAKAETSAPVAQTQPQQKAAKEEPPPSVQSVQPKPETPAPTPSGQGAGRVTQKEATLPQVQAESKQMPGPVTPRAPAVAPVQPQQAPTPVQPATPSPSAAQPHPKAREELATQGVLPPVVQTQPLVNPVATEVGPSQIGSLGYPYSIYLGSYRTVERANKAISMYQHEELPVYWSRVNLGEKGTWYRVFAGYFRSKAEASGFITRKQLKDAEVKMTKYSVLIGMYSTREEAQQKSGSLLNLGFPSYVIPEAQAKFRLYSGAFSSKQGAEQNVAELASKGVQSRAMER